MTQSQMTAYLADRIGISKRQAKSALDELNELVTRQLKKEGSLRLAGLGVFRKRKLAARITENVGYRKLIEHLGSVVTLMKLSKDNHYAGFLELLDRVHPRYGETGYLRFNGTEPETGL